MPQTFRLAVAPVGFSGRVVYVSSAKAEASYKTAPFDLEELDIIGSRYATVASFEAVIAFLKANPTACHPPIPKILPWSRADKALAH